MRRSVPPGGEGETFSRCLIRCGAGYDRVMKPAFVGLLIGGATVLISVGVAWIVAAAREAREATSRRLLGAQPRNVKEGSACSNMRVVWRRSLTGANGPALPADRGVCVRSGGVHQT